jgi:hypothetical protein
MFGVRSRVMFGDVFGDTLGVRFGVIDGRILPF